MTSRVSVKTVGFLAMAIGFAAGIEVGRGQGADTFGGRKFTHVGVVVHDLDKTLKTYADVWNLDLPSVRVVKNPLPAGNPYGRPDLEVKLAQVLVEGFRIELIQPLTPSPFMDHLQRFDDSVHHLG